MAAPWLKPVTVSQPSTTTRWRQIGFFVAAVLGMAGGVGTTVVGKNSDPKAKTMIVNRREEFGEWQ